MNDDSPVNFADIVVLFQHYHTFGNAFGARNVDYSADGKIDFSDLVILAQNYNMVLAAALLVAASSRSSSLDATSERRGVALAGLMDSKG